MPEIGPVKQETGSCGAGMVHLCQSWALSAMAGEIGGGGPGGTFSSGLHLFHFLEGTRGTQYITKMGPFTSLSCFSAIAIDALVVLGPLRHLGALFLEGPQDLVPSTSRIIYPALLSAQF